MSCASAAAPASAACGSGHRRSVHVKVFELRLSQPFGYGRRRAAAGIRRRLEPRSRSRARSRWRITSRVRATSRRASCSPGPRVSVVRRAARTAGASSRSRSAARRKRAGSAGSGGRGSSPPPALGGSQRRLRTGSTERLQACIRPVVGAWRTDKTGWRQPTCWSGSPSSDAGREPEGDVPNDSVWAYRRLRIRCSRMASLMHSIRLDITVSTRSGLVSANLTWRAVLPWLTSLRCA